MALLGPKLFLAFALIFVGAYILAPRKKEVKVHNQAAVDWVAGNLEKSKTEAGAAKLAGAAEQAKADAASQADAVTAVYDKPSSPQGAAKPPDSLTVEALVRAMEAVVSSVPGFVPTLPLLPGLARQFMRNDPEGITFAPMEDRVLGYFTTRDKDKPRIVLNEQLKGLHAKGVDAALLADVLVHELDHAHAYFTGKAPKRTRTRNEINAHVAEGYYITALRNQGKLGPVDSREADPEKEAYYQEIRKVRVKFFNGELAELIRETYGPDPSGSQRRR